MRPDSNNLFVQRCLHYLNFSLYGVLINELADWSFLVGNDIIKRYEVLIIVYTFDKLVYTFKNILSAILLHEHID